MENVIQFESPRTSETVVCDFCGRSKEVAGGMLITGAQGKSICPACVEHCRKLVKSHVPAGPTQPLEVA